MTIRERTEETERQVLDARAAFAAGSRGREREEEPCAYRTAYQRDRDRVLHCKAFRRLKHKTQVFLSPEGDHYRTRLTHTLEVSQIARTIARALRLNEDLTEAVSLAHDLGHTPFGHAGERALNDLMEGGFRHYEQSVRVVERLENDGRGLNLTWEVRDGILRHTCGEQAATLEGRIVRLADRVAYINHDIDDAVRAGVLREEDVPADIRAALGDRRTTRIDTLVTAIVENSGDDIGMDAATAAVFDRLHAFMFDAVYRNPAAKSEEAKVDGLIRRMFEFFAGHPQRLPAEYRGICEKEGIPRAVCDYIAGMTDNYALEVYDELFIPQGWRIKTF
ncbi:MAG TPA: deoxyguanosinetriphosphate triphosphohydrolase [Firmicutes bacterium]|nr:deoxyguanosinetriphosphate triphosphohydrolase [Bacillota bacterium]